MNTAALESLGWGADTEDPPGGAIRRRRDGEPDGVLEESAAAQVLYARLAENSLAEFARKLRETVNYYASFGITTIQDGGATAADIVAFRQLAAEEPFAVDVAAYQYVNPDDTDTLEAFRHDTVYAGGYRLAGIKFGLDGSPQGRTAWMTAPYTERPHGADPDYAAYPTVDPAAYISAAARVLGNGIPMLVHANGDAAIDLMLEGVKKALSAPGARDHRAVAIHAQLMRADQLDTAATLGVVPSFFSAHTYFWGDWHLQSFGRKRGENISPTRWALDRDVRFTIHNDAPVVPPDMLRLIWATVNRRTRSGQTIGPDQQLSVREALYAATLGGAYQYFEETSKGSISEGKQADLVILSENPLLVDPRKLADVEVFETFARGRSVYRRPD